ncbi:type I-E CRISPR-associated protein Cas6/Cse3/CasE [Castellaniella sp. S9]|uniref:type I-E CRISPR-associated protein Cas6/Cse3/CasE n=1 Tax=Castellaniella sp. S9 TaxID=2993652 RepID=UPI0022B34043|nr:type I-E CRISPR-associated protein Cas6/Cse3/CasE [Castellaniella sp. S9]
MSGLHLLRIPVQVPPLLKFAAESGITQEDETLGYTLHAWFAALFGTHAPRPFRYFDRRNEVLAYAHADAAILLEQAQTYASPLAWAALDVDGVASKTMPETWQAGRRLRIEALVCPVARQDNVEKDVFLRTLDRLGDDAPGRAEVYRDWFTVQWNDVLRFGHVEILGMTARTRLLRRSRRGGNRLRVVERPQVLIGADAAIGDGQGFARLLARGIGRHRAFGFGMVSLSPPR